MAKCITEKKMYKSQELAEDALIDAWIRYRYTEGRGPVAVYLCDDCKQYHLTSKGNMNARLAEHLASGKIALHQEASRWEQKLRSKR